VNAPPLAFRWDGAVMTPLRPKAAQQAYGQGEGVHWLEEASERSWASHAQQFAWIAEAWQQLPEDVMELYPSPEHLRKRALIQAGFFRETVIDAGSKAAALRVAAYARGDDEFAHVVTRGPLVVIRKARSQRMTGHDRMTRAEFQASKDGVMKVVGELIGVEPEAA